MKQIMLCRNRVKGFVRWKAIFDSHSAAHRSYGMHLVNLWRTVGDENTVFFLFRLESIEQARAFISASEAAETGRSAGVIDGEYHFTGPNPDSPLGC